MSLSHTKLVKCIKSLLTYTLSSKSFSSSSRSSIRYEMAILERSSCWLQREYTATANEFKIRFRNHTKSISNIKIPKRDRTFQIHLATEEKQPTTQDQVGNHKENPGMQTQPEKMRPIIILRKLVETRGEFISEEHLQLALLFSITTMVAMKCYFF